MTSEGYINPPCFESANPCGAIYIDEINTAQQIAVIVL